MNKDKLNFERNRSMFADEIFDNEKNVNYIKMLIGLIIYIILFVLFIPHMLIKYKLFYILAAYFPNLDMLATVLGFKGGPVYIWKYLYNPVSSTITGFVSTTFINALALLGLTYVIAYYTHKTKDIAGGWSRAFFMIPLTYLLPGNILVYVLDRISKELEYLNLSRNIEYGLIIFIGLLFVVGIILIEAVVIQNLSPLVSNLIHYISKIYNIIL